MFLRTFCFALLLLPVIPNVALAEDEAPALSFFLPTPEGWRTETIPFPLGFAPELDYEGLEEVRFAPGMFKAGSEDFWTYSFIWWIAEDSSISAEGLETDLEAYFSGLARAVTEGRDVDLSKATFEVSISAPDSGSDSDADYVGSAKIFDPFVTSDMISLNLRVEKVLCSEEHRLAVFFGLSPKPSGDPVWSDVAAIRQGFRCQK